MKPREIIPGLLFILAATLPMFFFSGGWSLVFLAAVGLVVNGLSRLLPVLGLVFLLALLLGPA
jgi:hypothetical protein